MCSLNNIIRHPCAEKPNVVADIGLRLQEGLQDLKLEQQLAPTREAISRTLATGSTNFLKAVEGVRGRWAQRSVSSSSIVDDAPSSRTSSSPVEVTKSDADMSEVLKEGPPQSPTAAARPLSVAAVQAASETKAALGAWGSGIGSFLSQRASRFTLPRPVSTGTSPAGTSAPEVSPSNSVSMAQPSPPSGTGAPKLRQLTMQSKDVNIDHGVRQIPSPRVSEESVLNHGTAL